MQRKFTAQRWGWKFMKFFPAKKTNWAMRIVSLGSGNKWHSCIRCVQQGSSKGAKKSLSNPPTALKYHVHLKNISEFQTD